MIAPPLTPPSRPSGSREVLVGGSESGYNSELFFLIRFFSEDKNPFFFLEGGKSFLFILNIFKI